MNHEGGRVNDSDPDRRPRRPNQDFEWNADLMGSGLTVLGLLVVGAVLLVGVSAGH